jgi:hypothetical protein
MRSKRRLLFLLFAIVLMGYGIWWTGRTNTDTPNLSGPPTMMGRIDVAKTIGGNFLIVPGDGSAQNGVNITIRPEAKFSRRDGKPVVFRTGQIVSVWCSGPVATSMPPRQFADMVVIEADGE